MTPKSCELLQAAVGGGDYQLSGAARADGGSKSLDPPVFGDKWNSIIPVLELLCIVGLLRSVGNPIGSLLMAKARVDISFKFNVFKTFLFIPGDYRRADGGRNRC